MTDFVGLVFKLVRAKTRAILVIVALFAPVWGCSKDSTPETPTPTPAASCNYTLSITSQSVAAGGGSGTSVLTRTSGSCGWTAASDSGFVTVATGSGSDAATLSYSVAANTSTQSRTGRITVTWTGGTTQLTITQAGVAAPSPPPPPVQPCTYTLDPVGVTVPAAGATGQTTLTVTGDNCSWTARPNQTWIKIDAGFSGTTTGTIAYTVAANPGPVRFGRIIVDHTVGSSDFGFTQDPQPTTAVLTVSPDPCGVRPNPNLPNTDITKNTNFLDCTFDASGSASSTGINLYEFWLGGPPASVESFLLGAISLPTLIKPVLGCGYTGGTEIVINVYLIVNSNSGARVISPPLPVTFRKTGSC